jgi:hypothetical protein
MDELLRFLVDHCSFLYKEFGFRLIDSKHYPDSAGSGYIDLKSGDLRIQLVRDRTQIFLDFFPLEGRRGYSLGLIWHYLVKKRLQSAEMNAELATFVYNNFPTISAMFSPERVAKTVAELEELEEVRFGQ